MTPSSSPFQSLDVAPGLIATAERILPVLREFAGSTPTGGYDRMQLARGEADALVAVIDALIEGRTDA